MLMFIYIFIILDKQKGSTKTRTEMKCSQEFELHHSSSILENCTPRQSIDEKTPSENIFHWWNIKS